MDIKSDVRDAIKKRSDHGASVKAKIDFREINDITGLLNVAKETNTVRLLRIAYGISDYDSFVDCIRNESIWTWPCSIEERFEHIKEDLLLYISTLYKEKYEVVF